LYLYGPNFSSKIIVKKRLRIMDSCTRGSAQDEYTDI